MEFGKAVRELRLKLGLSHATLAAEDPDGRLDRLDVLQVEKGKKANSWEIRKGLSRALHLTLDDFDAYCEGRIDLWEVLKRRHPKQSRAAKFDGHDGHGDMIEATSKGPRSERWPDWSSAELEAFTDASNRMEDAPVDDGPKNDVNICAAILFLGFEKTEEPQPVDFSKRWIERHVDHWLDRHDVDHRPRRWLEMLKLVPERLQKIRGPLSSGRERPSSSRQSLPKKRAKPRTST